MIDTCWILLAVGADKMLLCLYSASRASGLGTLGALDEWPFGALHIFYI